jgi:mannosyltransferase
MDADGRHGHWQRTGRGRQVTTALAPLPVTATEPGTVTARRRRRRRGTSARAAALLVGCGALLTSFAGSWIPSLWGDEAVSIMSAERSLPSLFTALGHIDAVHGAYYLLLHGWVSLFGTSALSVRLPSAIAVGFAAAGTVVLGDLLLTRRIGLVAGIVLALLPRVTYIGMEARGFALSMAIAVWLTVLFVVLLRRRTTAWSAWLAYAAGLALASYLFLDAALLVVAHGVLLLRATHGRAMLRRWCVATGLAAILAAPVIVWGAAESRQIAYLASASPVTPEAVFVEPWFSSPELAVAGWILMAIGAISFIRSRGTRRGGAALTAWLLVPMGVLLLGNWLLAPMYATRYLAFCAPAAALLTASGIVALGTGRGPRGATRAGSKWIRREWMPACAGALLLALVVPGYLAQRGPFAMDGGNDWQQASAIVGAHAEPGDAVVFGLASRPSRMPRLAMYAYPADYRGLRNVELVTPYYRTPGLRDVAAPLAAIAPRLASVTTVWAVEPSAARTALPKDITTLRQLGFALDRRFPVHRDSVYELTRRTP